MNRQALFSIWAPENSIWSVWAKPVLFAQKSDVTEAPSSEELIWNADINWAQAFHEKVCFVVDLPGASSVVMGLALAAIGYRPVPLFNGCSGGTSAVVSVDLLERALESGVHKLRACKLGADAAPVFLLDANRMTQNSSNFYGKFDNRWITFPQDFPSANFLLSQQIRKVVVIVDGEDYPKSDLVHVLLRWQHQGLTVLLKDIRNQNAASAITLRKPNNFRLAWYRVLAMIGLKKNSAGGFGEAIPELAEHSGGSGWT